MKVMVEGYPHRTGEHCASTAIRNIMAFSGVELSEGMVVGLSSGLGFYYLSNENLSPTRMFHGRTASLEGDFCRNTSMSYEQRIGLSDDAAWRDLREQLDSGRPALLSTDTFYLGYHNTTSHFPGHRVVAVGYDSQADEVYMADRKFSDYQVCSMRELQRSRNADDYPASCENELLEFTGGMELGRPMAEAIRSAAVKNAKQMLGLGDEDADGPFSTGGVVTGVAGIRAAADDLPCWKDLDDWSWAARFGYQVVIKRGAGGSFFRSMYADFLEEAAAHVPEIGAAGLPGQMAEIATGWRELAALLKDQSEREQCAPELFGRAGEATHELADKEEAFFRELLTALPSA